jgi:hypothetical protein
MGVIQEEAELRAQASVGFPLNLGSASQVASQLYAVEEVHKDPVTRKVRR